MLIKLKQLLFLLLFLLVSCATDIPQNTPSRQIASENCNEIIKNIIEVQSTETNDLIFSKLHAQEKVHPSGKKYTELIADPDIIENDPLYANFMNETIEIIYYPAKTFGHVKLRVGTTMYDFKGVKFTGIDKYHPKMKKNNASTSDGPIGFVFKVGADKIKQTKDDVEMMYLSSSIYNIPPYDLFSGKIKILEKEFNGRKYLVYDSNSSTTNLSNKREASGKIIQVDGKYFLESDDGYRVKVEKKEDGLYTQSYSCLTSATYAMGKYFNLKLNYGDFPKGIIETLPEDIQKSVMSTENLSGESPDVVIKYFAD
jgi:hypothetical protein